MSFADNLKQIRKDRNLSQEELAEILDVSRQAVGKWESGAGYPEAEKLLLISGRLNVSLDSLMSAEIAGQGRPGAREITGKITISSPHENVVVTCYKVQSSGRMRGGRRSPRYALFAVSDAYNSFWGQPTTFLGWYADQEQLAKEVSEIQDAISHGRSSYQLKYSVKVRRHWLNIEIVND